MERTLVVELPRLVGEQVLVSGWVHRVRRHANVAFVLVRDRTGVAQVVAAPATLPALPEETVVEVTGRVVANPKAPSGVELTEPGWRLLGDPAEPSPVELWRPELSVTLPVQLDQAAVSWRHPAQRLAWECAAASLGGFRSALDGRGFTEIQTPKLVATATESGANVFSVDYFGRTAYLAQSPQFYKQAMVGVFERVYEVGPVFRAEPHDTVRHLAEYVSLDVELGFIDSHRDLVRLLREVIAAMVAAIAQRCPAVPLPGVPAAIPVLHFREALRLVGAPAAEPDLAPEHERRLGEWALREHGSEFLVVEGYPARKRPFYTHPEPGAPEWTNSFDLLFRGLELVTGGQRLHRYRDYLAALAARGEDAAAYESYLQPFRHGMPPHGGFAIGLERWVARLLRVENLRRVALFPRDLHRLTP